MCLHSQEWKKPWREPFVFPGTRGLRARSRELAGSDVTQRKHFGIPMQTRFPADGRLLQRLQPPSRCHPGGLQDGFSPGIQQKGNLKKNCVFFFYRSASKQWGHGAGCTHGSGVVMAKRVSCKVATSFEQQGPGWASWQGKGPRHVCQDSNGGLQWGEVSGEASTYLC